MRASVELCAVDAVAEVAVARTLELARLGVAVLLRRLHDLVQPF